MQTKTTLHSASLLMGDKLIDFRQVCELVGSRCKTGHTARVLAARGQIRAVRLNERVIRYSEQSVLDLIAGRAPVVSADCNGTRTLKHKVGS